MGAELRKQGTILWMGDLIVISLVTLVGFASHGELQAAGWRMLTTFVPLVVAWFVVGLPVGLFDVDHALASGKLWFPLWGAVLAGPLAVLIRSLLLGMRPIVPAFALVITGVFGLAILVWRLVFYVFFHRKDG